MRFTDGVSNGFGRLLGFGCVSYGLSASEPVALQFLTRIVAPGVQGEVYTLTVDMIQIILPVVLFH